MARLVLVSVLLLVAGETMARPASYDEYLAVEGEDMATVGSLRREVRQPAPIIVKPEQEKQRFATEVSDLLSAGNEPKKSHNEKHQKNASGKSNEGGFFKTFGSDADGEKGYLKKSFSKGDHGYKTLDTFHKKLGDRYGFEEHEAFGRAKGAEDGKHHGKSASYKSKNKKNDESDDHEGAGTDVESHYADDDGGDTSGYYEGGDDHYSGGGGGDGGADSSSYDNGGAEGYSESYSSGSDGEGGSGESYSAGGESSGESSGESYY